jgi:hypothetical protein
MLSFSKTLISLTLFDHIWLFPICHKNYKLHGASGQEIYCGNALQRDDNENVVLLAVKMTAKSVCTGLALLSLAFWFSLKLTILT